MRRNKISRYKKAAIFLVFALWACTGFCESSTVKDTFHCWISGSSYNLNGDPMIRVYPEDMEDRVKNLPIYEFKDDTEGSFFRQFTDSLAAFCHRYDVMKILHTENLRYEYVDHLPDSMILITKSVWWKDTLEKCKGVVITSDNKLLLLFDNDSQWINKLHLQRTRDIMTIMMGKSYSKGLPILHFTSSIQVWAVLDVLPDHKVEPLMIYNLNTPIQGLKGATARFDWIDDFYRAHNLPVGCGFQRQKTEPDPIYYPCPDDVKLEKVYIR